MAKEYNEQAEEFLVEEEAARAGTASSSSALSKQWYETFVRLHKAQPDSEEAVRVAPLLSGILRHYKAFARLYEAQSEIDRDAALKDVAQMFEMFSAYRDDKERRCRHDDFYARGGGEAEFAVLIDQHLDRRGVNGVQCFDKKRIIK